MPDNTPETATVSVEIPVTPESGETVETPEQVTVITPPAESSGVDPTTVQELLDQRERAVRAELRNAELEQQIAEMQAQIAITQVTAEVAAQEVQEIQSAVEEIAEGEQSSPELDVEPTREHPFWRHP